MLWLVDTIRGHGASLAQATGVQSHDLFPLAGDTKHHQLYKPPGHTTWGLLLFGRSGEHTFALAVARTTGSSPCHGR